MQSGCNNEETAMRTPWLASLIGAAAVLAPLHAVGAGISAAYHPLTGNQWAVDFVVTGDGTPAVIGDFTIYFPDTSFAALSVAASPAAWDSIVVQPDTALHSPGFLDSLALAGGIGSGVSVSGFQVKFNFLGTGNPLPLRFDINDANFHAVYSGLTSVTAVPEPETAWLILLGLGAIGGARMRRHGQQRRTGVVA
jgi:PEP-CTERM motif